MASPIIPKSPTFAVAPNLGDYDEVRHSFRWEKARAELEGLPGGALNIAHEAVDRHAASAPREIALRWMSADARTTDFSYDELRRRTAQFANALAALGIRKGERVFSLLGRVPELYVSALGTLKHGAVFSPLFSAFGPEPVKVRLGIGEGAVLITTAPLYRKKVEPIRGELPKLRHVLIVGEGELPPNTLHFSEVVATASDTYETCRTRPEDPALLHFTSGTTGRPKGALHVHEAVVAHHVTGRYALDLHPGDIFWCTADPGWVTGTSYGIISPLTNRATLLVDEAEFDAERWYRTLETQRVNVFYTAPTAVRMMMKAGLELVRAHRYPALRFIASVGEPLNPECVVWGVEAFGMAIHDNWWQTETGGIMIANFAVTPVRPGSMGRPLPGIDAAIVRRNDAGHLEVVREPGVEGELALRPGWPSMFRGYLNEEVRYRKCFEDGWYLSGDLARQDEDGYFWFVGRADDVIKSAGHLIGPFEVESALLEHPAVAEAAVIGKPDPLIGEVVKAFVSLKPGYQPSDALKLELLGHARLRLGPAVAPKELAFATSLPRTRSGKLMRRLLKARELGLPEGDTSTLEGGA